MTFLRALTLGLLLAVLCRVPAQAEPAYQPATLLGIEKNVQVTPISWLRDVVVSSYETVRYDLHVQVGDRSYIAQFYPPVQPDGPLPSEWQANRPLQVRIDKGSLFIKLSYDGEVETRIRKSSGPKPR